MSAHYLKLNLDKTELLFLPWKTCPFKDLSITDDNSTNPGSCHLPSGLQQLSVV
jgi:hypothetical protein